MDKEWYEYKPSIKAIVQYTEGGYFGDSEIFAKVAGIYPDHAGREASAIGHQDCSIFVLSQKDVNRIRDLFPAEFEQMKGIGVKRFKNHQIQIANQVKDYLLEQRCGTNLSDEDSSKDSNSDSNQTDPYSINSEKIEREFQNVPHYQ